MRAGQPPSFVHTRPAIWSGMASCASRRTSVLCFSLILILARACFASADIAARPHRYRCASRG